MKLLEFLELLPNSQEIEIVTEDDLIYEGDSEDYIGEDYEITDVDSYADVRNYDIMYSVISIGVRWMIRIDDKVFRKEDVKLFYLTSPNKRYVNDCWAIKLELYNGDSIRICRTYEKDIRDLFENLAKEFDEIKVIKNV